MARTRRREPTNREARQRRMEREGEREMERERRQHSLPPRVAQAKQEAETYINHGLANGQITPEAGEVLKAAQEVPFSRQSPGHDEAFAAPGPLLWWNSAQLDDYVPVSEYADPKRQKDLRMFALVAPWCLNAISILTKKVQALQWELAGGRNLVNKWQKRINDFGGDWDIFAGRWVRAYSESDKPAVAELIRAAPSWAVDPKTNQLTKRGEEAMLRGDDKAWEVVSASVMDPLQIWPTRSEAYPLIYYNPHTGKRYKLRDYDFMWLVDMPTVDSRFPNWGTCAVSRAVWAAQEDRMIIRYVMEKMSENPGAGMIVGNFDSTTMETALNGAQAQRESRGVVFYKGIVFIPVLDPSGTISLEFLNFAGLPDEFDRLQVYNITKEIVATAFGMDPLEFGSIPGSTLGSGEQSTVMSIKSAGKGLGAITQGIERQFRAKLLPESLEFQFQSNDVAEELSRAEVEGKLFENAERYANIAGPQLAQQYLADKGAIPQEYLQGLDITDEVTLEDDEQQVKWWGTRIKMDRNGRVIWQERKHGYDDAIGHILAHARTKHATGEIDADTLAELALSEIADLRQNGRLGDSD